MKNEVNVLSKACQKYYKQLDKKILQSINDVQLLMVRCYYNDTFYSKLLQALLHNSFINIFTLYFICILTGYVAS